MMLKRSQDRQWTRRLFFLLFIFTMPNVVLYFPPKKNVVRIQSFFLVSHNWSWQTSYKIQRWLWVANGIGAYNRAHSLSRRTHENSEYSTVSMQIQTFIFSGFDHECRVPTALAPSVSHSTWGCAQLQLECTTRLKCSPVHSSLPEPVSSCYCLTARTFDAIVFIVPFLTCLFLLI